MVSAPYTAEEAREKARRNATQAARIRSGDALGNVDDPYVQRALSEHERAAASLRLYADMREALEEIGRKADALKLLRPNDDLTQDAATQIGDIARRFVTPTEEKKGNA